MRGTFEGKRDLTMDAGAQVNPAVDPGYEITRNGSHTLQHRDSEDTETLRARLIEATVQAIAEGSGPRLDGSRL
jgi:hypothetical protein